MTVQSEILELLRGLSQSRGMAVVLVTHDWGVVADICDRAAVLYRGDLIECADVFYELFAQPASIATPRRCSNRTRTARRVGQPLPTIQDTLARMDGAPS